MKAPPFDYVRAGSLEEAVAARTERGPENRVLAGGQTLLWHMKFGLAAPTALVDIGTIAGLDTIDAVNGHVRIGAMARQRDVERSELVLDRIPLLAKAIRYVANPPVRNRGTVVGSVAAAAPYAEIPAAVLALNGELEIVGPAGTRVQRVEDFLLDSHRTALGTDEVVEALRLTRPTEGSGSAFVEVTRSYHNRAIVGVGAVVTLADGRITAAAIAACNTAPVAKRFHSAEQALIGQEPTAELFADAAADAAAEVDPPTDEQASGRYRKKITRPLIVRALTQAAAQAQES